jgi:nucleotide-binding universal stress UspA family protein
MKDPSQLHKILIAVEDSSYSDIAAHYGFALAKQLGAEVGLLHVNQVPVSAPYTVDPMLNESPIVIPEMMQFQEDASKKLLNRLAETFGKDCTIYNFLKIGNPIDEILVTADEWNADLIILGTHGRTGLDHFIAGSVAEKVIRKANCPVLIIPNKEKKLA